MPKTAQLHSGQSTIGLFRALGADPKSLPRSRPLYRRLVEIVEGGIARGDVPAGRLPPERDLAKALRVSRATVVAAYRELESRGLVRGYVGRGTFVSARPMPAARRSRGAGRSPPPRCRPPTRRSVTWCARPRIRR
jgi:GntR family transcriptional regulator/MocR family aminotransferase